MLPKNISRNKRIVADEDISFDGCSFDEAIQKMLDIKTKYPNAHSFDLYADFTYQNGELCCTVEEWTETEEEFEQRQQEHLRLLEKERQQEAERKLRERDLEVQRRVLNDRIAQIQRESDERIRKLRAEKNSLK